MSFATWSYAAFLPAVLVGHRLLRGRPRLWFLLGASYLFYAAWDVRFLGLIWISTIVDYVVGLRLGRDGSHRKRWVGVSVLVNLGILGGFKYAGFFVESAAVALERIGFSANLPTLSIILPVGISFYTFQTLSYTIDVYRRRIEPEPRFDVFALFVAFFPQLVAGPIERAERLIPQLADRDRVAGPRDLGDGALLIGRGLLRKLAIADAVAPYVQTAFADPSTQSRLSLMLGVVGFSLQIYGDFAGYTDIARGSARMLGVELMENFRQPYMSRSITEFWRWWHISLSTWLRDYLYIPLGGNRGGRVATYRNLMVTMLLGGLWHGAAWTFVVWGGLHGAYLALERMRGHGELARRAAVWAIPTAVLVSVTWIPFRAASIGDVWTYLSGLVAGGGTDLPTPSALVVVGTAFLLAVITDLWQRRAIDFGIVERRPLAAGFGAGVGVVSTVILSGTSTVPFIYFQF